MKIYLYGLILLIATNTAFAADADGNGVPDDVEQALVERFKPCIVLPYSDRGVAPEPVDIMHVNSYVTGYNSITGNYYKVPTLWVSFYNTLGQYICTRSLFRVYQQLYVDYFATCATGIRFTNGNYSGSTSETHSYIGKIPDSDCAFAQYYIRIHADYAGPDNGDGYYDQPGGWYDTYLNGHTVASGSVNFTWEKGSNYPATTYAHLFVENNETTIQYWFFYPFNDAWNNHEGDWEHINVIISNQDPTSAAIKRVVFYFHHKLKIEELLPSVMYMKIIDNTHPVVFVGGYTTHLDGSGEGTHASYPICGKWNNISPFCADETVTEHFDYSKYIHYNSLNAIIIKGPEDYDYNTNPEMSWLNAKIRWGHIAVSSPLDWRNWPDVGQFAPLGPAHQGSWENKEGGADLYTTAPTNYPSSWSWPTDNTAPTVSVISPGSSAYLIKSRQYKIQWYAADNIGGTNGIKNCFLYYSIDGGYNWMIISGANPILNYNWFNWTVPDVESKNCKIKIIAYDAMGYSAETVSPTFTIGSIFAVPTISGNATYSGTKAELPDVSLRSYVNKPYADQAKYKPKYCQFTWAGIFPGSIDCGTYYYANIIDDAVSLPKTYTAKWVYNIWEDGVVVGLAEGPVSSSITVYPPNPYDPIVSETNTPEATAYSNGKKIMVDANGNIHIVYISGDNVYYTTSSDEGETWATPIVVGSGEHPAIELTADNFPTICWNNANCLYSAKMVSGVFEEPQLIYTGPEGTEISYLSYVLDQSTNNSYLGWVDEGVAGSSVLISAYNPSISNSLSPTPIDQGGTTAFKSPSLALDRTGNLKIAWSHSGKVYFKDNSGFVELGENGIHPIVDAYGDKTTVVWQEEIAPGIYQVVKKSKNRSGWSDKEVISYADSLNADFPVVAAGQYVYSKNVNGKDYDLIWNAEYDDGWSLHTQNISGAQGGISRYPSIAFKQDWPKSKLYMVWTEEMTESKNGSKAIVPLVKAYVKSVDPVPVYYIDLGTERADAFAVDKNGALYYGLQPEYSVDYHQTELKYRIQNLNPSKKYRIKVVYYQETDANIKQTLSVDKTFNAKTTVKPKTLITEEHWLPAVCVKDGQIEVSITKTQGEYAVCSVIALYEYDRDCVGKSNDDLADGINRSSSAISYDLMQNYPNPNTGKTSIKYQLAQPGKVSLKIYNTLGQVVKTLVSREQSVGIYNVTWDGRDNNGEILANGVYFYRLESGDYQETKKMVVVK